MRENRFFSMATFASAAFFGIFGAVIIGISMLTEHSDSSWLHVCTIVLQIKSIIVGCDSTNQSISAEKHTFLLV